MNALFEIFVNLYQGFLMIFFMHLRLPSKRNVQWWEDIIFVVLIGAFLSLYLFPWMVVNDALVFLFPFFYTIVTQRGTWLQRILWTIALGVLMLLIATISTSAYMNFVGVDMDTLMQYSILRISYVLSTNIAHTVFFTIVARIGHKDSTTFPGRSSLVVFITALLLEAVTTELLFTYQVQTESGSRILLFTTVCVFGLLILTLLLYEILAQSAKNRHMAEMRLQILSSEQAHQQEMTAFYNEMLAVQHDLKKQLNTVKQLLSSSNDLDRDAIMDLLRIEKPLSIQHITGNTAVDAILAAKHALMEQHNISFTYQPYPLQILPIDSASFCVLLSNILDNAIEAVMRITDHSTPKEINLQFARSWSMFYITCVNTMNPDTIKKYGERFVSSKADKRIHGFGIESIRHIVETNGGSCNINMDGCQFKVDLVLPDNENHQA